MKIIIVLKEDIKTLFSTKVTENVQMTIFTNSK